MTHASCGGDGYSVDLAAEESDLAVTLVQTIAEIEGFDPESLPPLERTIHGESLEAMARSSTPVTISFVYHSYRVTVYAEDELQIEPLGC